MSKILLNSLISRGRGSYRGRGRGNYYRNSNQQHHQHQSSAQQHSNVPFYEQSMNLMNSNMQSGQSGYGDGGYHDAPPNRYDWIYSFSQNFKCSPFNANDFDRFANEWQPIRSFQLAFTMILRLIIYTSIFYLIKTINILNIHTKYRYIDIFIGY